MLGDIKVSTPVEIEQLQNEKMRLEEEARALNEELKHLEKRRKILGEKVAIQELKNENAAKRQTINWLVGNAIGKVVNSQPLQKRRHNHKRKY